MEENNKDLRKNNRLCFRVSQKNPDEVAILLALKEKWQLANFCAVLHRILKQAWMYEHWREKERERLENFDKGTL